MPAGRHAGQHLQRDLSTATARWPKFAPEAIANGFHSVHALPMRLRGAVVGALNLFQTEMEGIDSEGVRAAQAFADIATIAILQFRATLESNELMDQLNTALNTRVVIEQAKGIVAEHNKFDMAQAFDALRGHARINNLRLTDVAAAVVSGKLNSTDLRHASAPRSEQRKAR